MIRILQLLGRKNVGELRIGIAFVIRKFFPFGSELLQQLIAADIGVALTLNSETKNRIRRAIGIEVFREQFRGLSVGCFALRVESVVSNNHIQMAIVVEINNLQGIPPSGIFL